MARELQTPLTKEIIQSLHAGESVLLSGTIYTGRDAAHKRMAEALEKGEPLPFDVKDETIYYVGPCPAKPGDVIGSCGPTTSGRMDAYAPRMIQEGLHGMIGKGLRSKEVVDAMKEHIGVYFGALGGAGTLMASCVEEAEVVAYPDLGAEAIYRLKVKNMPLVVVIDSEGNDLYQIGREKYRA